MISSLTVLHALDDAVNPVHTEFWNFGFHGRLQQATEEIVSADKIHTF